MKINVIQGKFVNENSFLSIANLFNNLFSKTSLNFKFYSSDDYMLENLEDDDQKEEILKKIKFDEEVINNGEGQTFEYFFKEITLNRDYAHHINKDELVIYLTGEKNERNFFGWIDEKMKNCFINTSIWKSIYDSNVDVIYPISYEIISWVLRVLMFKNPTELYKNAHFNDITCLMNFCEDLKKHEIKTKTGEICKDCIDRINNKGISQEKLMDIYSSLDKIRNFILNRENHIIFPKVKVVKINGEIIQFILPEYGDLIIPLEQRLISVYWFFLRNNQEILTKSLKNYREEILSLHTIVNTRYSPEKIAETIDKILGISKDSVYNSKDEFSSVKSKINGKIKEIIPFKISKEYIISGVRLEPNQVLLDRKFFIDINE
jgi:hypothetical protein